MDDPAQLDPVAEPAAPHAAAFGPAWLTPGGIAVLFVVVMLPFAASLGVYHGDERYYTNAALEMRAAGDPWTPLWADGSPRWKKPLLPYWMVEGGFRLVGVSALGSRLLHLACGGALVLVTARIARLAAGSARAASAAAAIYAGSSAVQAAAVRANPDAPLALGVGLLLLGALRLERDPGDRGAAWPVAVGAGIAVAAKLLLGAGCAAALLARCAVAGERRARLASLARPLPWALGLAVALPAVLPLHLAPGDGLGEALDDQITGKIALTPASVAAGTVAYALDPLRHLAPFAPAALILWLASGALRRATGRRWTLFVAAWVGGLVLLFGAGEEHHGRYLLPVYPLVAAWSGAVLVGGAGERTRRVLRAAAWIALVVTGLMALLLHRAPAVAAGCGLAAVACWALVGWARRSTDQAVPATAAAWALGMAAATGAARVATHVSPVPALERALGGAPVVVVEQPSRDELWDVAAHLRLGSAGQIRAIHAGGPAEAAAAPAPRLVPADALGERPAEVLLEPIRSAHVRDLLDWALHRTDARARAMEPAYALTPR